MLLVNAQLEWRPMDQAPAKRLLVNMNMNIKTHADCMSLA